MQKMSDIRVLHADICDMFAVGPSIQDLPRPWLIAEDCHVDANRLMECLDPMMQEGDYIVFEDTHPCCPDKSWMDASDMNGYEYGRFSNEKLSRVTYAMKQRSDRFKIDASIQDMYGYNGLTHINSVFVVDQR